MFSWIVALTLYVVVGQSNPAMALADLGLMTRSFLPAAKNVELVTESVAPVKIDPTRLGIQTESRAVAIVDWESGEVLLRKNAEWPLPIASITKLVTALVVLESDLPLDEPVEIQSGDARTGGIPYVVAGEQILASDLLHASLISSANTAMVALARATGLSPEEFAVRMNEVAANIGMKDATFVEPTGLDAGNVATARDVAVLIRESLQNNIIQKIVTLETYEFDAITGLHHKLRSTDALLGGSIARPPYRFMGGKTGFIEEAGYCFAAAASNADGNQVIAVVLGAPSKSVRFDEVSALLYWAFDAYEWK